MISRMNELKGDNMKFKKKEFMLREIVGKLF